MLASCTIEYMVLFQIKLRKQSSEKKRKNKRLDGQFPPPVTCNLVSHGASLKAMRMAFYGKYYSFPEAATFKGLVLQGLSCCANTAAFKG